MPPGLRPIKEEKRFALRPVTDEPQRRFALKVVEPADSPGFFGRIGGGLKYGFKESVASAYNTAANLPRLGEKVVERAQETAPEVYGKYGPQQVRARQEVLSEALGPLKAAEQWLRERAQGNLPQGPAPEGVTGKVAEAVGAAPVTIGTYLPGIVTMGPIAGMAATGALRESDKGWKAAGKAAAVDAALGGVQMAAAPLKLVPRIGVNAAAGVGSAALQGGGTEDMIAQGLVFGGLGGLFGKPGVKTRTRIPIDETTTPVDRPATSLREPAPPVPIAPDTPVRGLEPVPEARNDLAAPEAPQPPAPDAPAQRRPDLSRQGHEEMNFWDRIENDLPNTVEGYRRELGQVEELNSAVRKKWTGALDDGNPEIKDHVAGADEGLKRFREDIEADIERLQELPRRGREIADLKDQVARRRSFWSRAKPESDADRQFHELEGARLDFLEAYLAHREAQLNADIGDLQARSRQRTATANRLAAMERSGEFVDPQALREAWRHDDVTADGQLPPDQRGETYDNLARAKSKLDAAEANHGKTGQAIPGWFDRVISDMQERHAIADVDRARKDAARVEREAERVRKDARERQERFISDTFGIPLRVVREYFDDLVRFLRGDPDAANVPAFISWLRGLHQESVTLADVLPWKRFSKEWASFMREFRKIEEDAAFDIRRRRALAQMALEAARDALGRARRETTGLRERLFGKKDARPERGKPPTDQERLAEIDNPEDVARVIREMALEIPAIDAEAATRGAGWTQADAQSLTGHREVQAAARALGMTAEEFISNAFGRAYNAEEIVAAARLLSASTRELIAVAKEAAGGSDLAKARLASVLTRHIAIYEHFLGARAEAGRALEILKQTSDAFSEAEAIARIIDRFGGRDGVDKIARLLTEAAQKGDITGALKKLKDSTPWDLVIEYRDAAMLFSPGTWITAFVGNLMTPIWRTLFETPFAALMGALRGAGDRVYFREVGARMFGLYRGFADGFVKAAHSLIDDLDPHGQYVETHKGHIPGTVGSIVRIPFRIMGAIDSLFKEMNYWSEINALSVRQALNEGLTGRALAERIAQLRETPTRAMHDAAIREGEVQTFTNRLGRTLQQLNQGLRGNPLGRLMIPFYQTPANIVTYAMRISSLAPLLADVRADLLGRNGKVAQDFAVARITLGTAMSFWIATEVAQGNITGGGPSDKTRRAAWLKTHQPYSAKINGNWVSYVRLDPFGLTVGAVADFMQSREDYGSEDESAYEVGAMILMSAGGAVLNKTWMQGANDLISAMNDPLRAGPRFSRQFAGSFIPNFVSAYARANDPYLRHARTLIDSLKERTPLRGELFPKRDIFGEPIGISSPVDPLRVMPVVYDSVVDAMLAHDALPGYLERKISIDGFRMELTDAEYDFYATVSGRAAREGLEKLLQSDRYYGMADGDKREAIKDVWKDARKQTRALIKERFAQEIQPRLDHLKQEDAISRVRVPVP